jgi:hypothetical protein
MTQESVFFLAVYLVEEITAWQYFQSVFPLKRPVWLALLATTAAYGIAFLWFNVSMVWLNAMIFFVANFLLLTFFYAGSWKGKAFHTLILTCLMLATETLVDFLLGILFGGSDQYQTSMSFLVIFGVLSKLLFFLSTKLCLLIAGKTPHGVADAGPAALLFGSFSVAATIILVMMAQVVLVVDLPPRIETYMMIGSFVLLFSNILIYVGYQQNQKLNQKYLKLQLTRQKDDAETAYFKTLETQYDQQRVLLHDIRRHLTAIKGIAQNADAGEVVDYVTNLENLPALQNKVHYCENSMMNVVLSRYKELCQEKNIPFSIDVRFKSYDFLAPHDITIIFGNLLENAVEAAQDAPEPYVELRVDTPRGANLFLSITNSCGVPPQSDGAGGYLTRKPDKEKHGMGSKSVRAAVHKYGGTLSQFYEEGTGLFHTTVVVNKDKED